MMFLFAWYPCLPFGLSVGGLFGLPMQSRDIYIALNRASRRGVVGTLGRVLYLFYGTNTLHTCSRILYGWLAMEIYRLMRHEAIDDDARTLFYATFAYVITAAQLRNGYATLANYRRTLLHALRLGLLEMGMLIIATITATAAYARSAEALGHTAPYGVASALSALLCGHIIFKLPVLYALYDGYNSTDDVV